MPLPLVPASVLARLHWAIRERAAVNGPAFVLGQDDPACATSVLNYLLFTYWPELLDGETGAMAADTQFYNRYYWFLHLTRLWQRRRGYDAGMEQQAFRLLESAVQAGVELDPAALDEVERRAEEAVRRQLGLQP